MTTMPVNPTPAEGVVAPLDPDFAEALIEKLTEIATRDDLKGRHVVFNTEVRSIATIVGVAAKVIGRPLAARPAAPTQRTGEVDPEVIERLIEVMCDCQCEGSHMLSESVANEHADDLRAVLSVFRPSLALSQPEPSQ